MMWVIKDKETIIKTKFAFFPKRIGDYRLWFEKYYQTYDKIGSHYVPHWFVFKENIELYVKAKQTQVCSIKEDTIDGKENISLRS